MTIQIMESETLIAINLSSQLENMNIRQRGRTKNPNHYCPVTKPYLILQDALHKKTVDATPMHKHALLMVKYVHQVILY